MHSVSAGCAKIASRRTVLEHDAPAMESAPRCLTVVDLPTSPLACRTARVVGDVVAQLARAEAAVDSRSVVTLTGVSTSADSGVGRRRAVRRRHKEVGHR
jgi:hypothetical protein